MSTSIVRTAHPAQASLRVKEPSLFGDLEGHQIRRLAIATAVLSWGGIFFLIG